MNKTVSGRGLEGPEPINPMNEQYPTPRSLKDDPPQGFSNILVWDDIGKGWRFASCSDLNFLLKSSYTHWLPMPPAPSEPSQPWKEAWVKWYACPRIDHPTSAESFKAGWNAALEAAICVGEISGLDSSQYYPVNRAIQKLKAK